MQIALFGATGATGRLLAQGAIARGHAVTALVRNAQAASSKAQAAGSNANDARLDPAIRLIEGSAFDPNAVAQTLAGADAVLSALGARSLRREDVLERAIPVIVRGMQLAHLKRIIVLGSSGALASGLDKQPAPIRWLSEKLLYPTLMKWPVASQRAQYAALAASDLDWTMAMPPILTNRPATGRLRLDGDALPRYGTTVARADVARFMLDQLQSDTWLRRGVYLA